MQKYFKSLNNLLNLFRRTEGEERSLMSKLRDNYHLIIRDDDTLEEMASFKLSPLTVYMGVSTLMVVSAFFMSLLIIYTPLKRYIPGYGDLKKDSELIALRKKTGELEDLAESQSRYIQNFSNIVRGDMNALAELSDTSNSYDPSSALNPGGVANLPADESQNSPNASQNGSPATSFDGKTGSGQPVFTSDKPLELLYLVAPIRGDVTKPFEPAKGHFGIDIVAPKGTPVKSALDGMVVFAGFSSETGHTIGIQHANNLVSWYKHNSTLLKKEGQPVKAGEAIAIIGNTGEQSTGPHLHFELWSRGRAVNPRDFINF